MRATPCGSSENDLDLLTTGETPHGVVSDELGLKTKVGKVLLDLPTNEGTKETGTLSLTSIDFNDLLLEATLDKVVTGQPDVLRRAEALEGDFVFVRLLQLLPGDDLIDQAFLAFNDDESAVLHLLGLLLADLAGCLAELFQIFTSLVTPKHVLEGSLVEMVIDVVEGVLSDVTDDQVGVLPDLTALVGLHITDEQLDEGRLAGTVGPENSDTGGKRDLESDVVKLLNGLRGVLESDLTHLQQRLLFGLNTIQQRWVGELEPVVFQSFETIVRLGLRNGLNEFLEVATISSELEAVQVEDISDGVVKETGVVGDDD